VVWIGWRWGPVARREAEMRAGARGGGWGGSREGEEEGGRARGAPGWGSWAGGGDNRAAWRQRHEARLSQEED